MGITYNQYCELIEKKDDLSQALIRNLRLEYPEKLRIFEESIEKAKAEKKPPKDGLELIYKDIETYEEFRESLTKSGEEAQYRWGERIHTQRLQKFRQRNRDLYLQFTQRLNEEARKR